MITVKMGESLNEKEYKGLSKDDKPTDCAANSLFLELDTGDFYYFTGEEWAKVGAGASDGGGNDSGGGK